MGGETDSAEHPRTYVFALADGGGTVPPELGVARRLVERGHRVVVLAEEPVADQVRATGAELIAWTETWGQFQDAHLTSPLSLLRGMVDEMFLGPAPGRARDTAAALERVRPDLVVASFPMVGAMIAAEAAGVPFDVMIPNVYAMPAEGMPAFGVGLAPARGPLGRARDRIAGGLSTRLFDRFALAGLNALRAEYVLEPVVRSWDQLHHARRELVLTSAAFDFPATLPPNARYVGPVLDDPSWSVGDWSAPAGDDPLVLVALSSTFQDQGACLQRILDAVGALPVRALVTTGPALDPEALRAPTNAVVARSVPHGAVLPEAALVVTHGGHGTVVKALAAGVPLVILPHGRDQADNAVRVTARGAGASIPKSASSARIATAVSRVLGDPSYRVAAQRLGEAVRADAQGDALVRELEG